MQEKNLCFQSLAFVAVNVLVVKKEIFVVQNTGLSEEQSEDELEVKIEGIFE